MKAWQDLLRKVWTEGEVRTDRTGVGTRSIFGLSAKFVNTPDSFPAVTTKQLAVRQCFGEMASFLQGADNLDQFHANGCAVWDGNANSSYWKPREPGDVGRIYGVQWVDWRSYHFGGHKSTNQLQMLVEGLKKDPTSRRHIVTAWNPGELDQMCLPPCHIFFQCYVSNGELDLQVYMRSVDLVLGLPFDIAGYALLQHLIAREVNLEPRRLLFQFGDAHVYLNHSEAVETILGRGTYPPPRLELDSNAGLFDFHPTQARLANYAPWPAVKAELNV